MKARVLCIFSEDASTRDVEYTSSQESGNMRLKHRGAFPVRIKHATQHITMKNILEERTIISLSSHRVSKTWEPLAGIGVRASIRELVCERLLGVVWLLVNVAIATLVEMLAVICFFSPQSPSGPVKPALQGHSDEPGVLSEPYGQEVHFSGPEIDLYVPASHLKHDPAGPVLPAGHRSEQSSSALLPAGDVISAGHAKHVASDIAPVTPEYVPSSQVWHIDASEAPHDVENVPATHLVHSEVAPDEYLPASQSMHRIAPCEEYFPPSHEEHASGP